MTDIQIFNNPEFGSIRALNKDNGEVFFSATDTARALGYAKPQDAVARHCSLTARLEALRSEQHQQGMSKTRASRLTKMDAIAASPESVEHWLKILHEMESRYCAAAPGKE